MLKQDICLLVQAAANQSNGDDLVDKEHGEVPKMTHI